MHLINISPLNVSAMLPQPGPYRRYTSIEAFMSSTSDQNSELVRESLLYKEFLAEREEILRHKWIESEKAGHDIGFEKALLDWIVKHRSSWRAQRLQREHA